MVSQPEKDHNRSIIVAALACLLLLTFCTALSVFSHQERASVPSPEEAGPSGMGRHYAFISGRSQPSLYRAVYASAREWAEREGDYLELMGENLSVDYDKNELMEIAIDAKVDGIIVEADDSAEMTGLINRADSEGIPVVTVGSDSTSAERKSYVGFGYYDLGQNYGKRILQHAKDDPQSVLILMSPEAEDSSQNIIFQGIRETIERSEASRYFDLKTMAVPDASAFGAEESISALIMQDESLPDMIVCLNEIYTTCVCQALVDYNRVGDTIVYGFYENGTILSAIKKSIISATVTVNTSQMGAYCIEALREYDTYGYVNEYMQADIEVIDSDNVDAYLPGTKEGEDA